MQSIFRFREVALAMVVLCAELSSTISSTYAVSFLTAVVTALHTVLMIRTSRVRGAIVTESGVEPADEAADVAFNTRVLELCSKQLLDVGLPRLADHVRSRVTAMSSHWSVTDTVSFRQVAELIAGVRQVRKVLL